MQKFKKLFYSALSVTLLCNLSYPVNSTEKEVKVYSGRHYNTDRAVYKRFAQETGINYELGSEWSLFQKRLTANIALYRMNVKNLLVAQRAGEDQYIGRNAGKTRRHRRVACRL